MNIHIKSWQKLLASTIAAAMLTIGLLLRAKTNRNSWQKLLASGIAVALLTFGVLPQASLADIQTNASQPAAVTASTQTKAVIAGVPTDPTPPPRMHGWELQATIDNKVCPNCNALYDELGKRDDWLQITVLDTDSLQCKLGGCDKPPENWLGHPGPENSDRTQAVLDKYFANVDEADKWVNDERKAWENGNLTAITPKRQHHHHCLVLRLGKKVAVVVINDAKCAAKVARTAAGDIKDTAEAGVGLVVERAKSAEHLVAVHVKAAVKKVGGCVGTLLGKLKNMLGN